jgi:hypothetical protein
MNKIEFVTAYPEISLAFPEPVPASKAIPQWYKDQPSYMGNDSSITNGQMKLTVKKCQAFFDAMSAGYILKMPMDLYVDTTDGNQTFELPLDCRAYQSRLMATHTNDQVSHMKWDEDLYIRHILRIHPTWLVRTPKGYSSLFTQPMHQEPSPIFAVSAIIDTDNFLSDGHLSFFVKKGFKGVIKQGTPLIQVIPFKRDEWEMKVDGNYDTQLIEAQRLSVRSTFQNGYKLKYWVKKVFK